MRITWCTWERLVGVQHAKEKEDDDERELGFRWHMKVVESNMSENKA
jgi:hypothetical protein